MASTQEHTATEVRDFAEDGDAATPAAEGVTTSALDKTKGAVGTVVGLLTGGIVIAAAAGLVLGAAVGVVIGRRSAPAPPRWQVWR